jgi:hypothetical protein
MKKTIKRLNILDEALMYNGLGAYIEDLRKAITALELLSGLVDALEDAVIKLEADWYLGDNKKQLIQKAKDVLNNE